MQDMDNIDEVCRCSSHQTRHSVMQSGMQNLHDQTHRWQSNVVKTPLPPPTHDTHTPSAPLFPPPSSILALEGSCWPLQVSVLQGITGTALLLCNEPLHTPPVKHPRPTSPPTIISTTKMLKVSAGLWPMRCCWPPQSPPPTHTPPPPHT